VLEKPDLPDETLATALGSDYGLRVVGIAFLPLGADWHTAVYRVVADDGRAYFLKLRSGTVDDTGVVVSRLLHDQGVAQVIPPLRTGEGRLWTRVDRFALTLYPFVEGDDGYTRALSGSQWRQLGGALRGIHATRLPELIAARIPRDTFAPTWRDALRRSQERAESESFADPAAAELAALLRAERERIRELIRRTDELAGALSAAPPTVVLCHGDWHPGNALLGADGALRVVDWDTLVFAPRERDLSLIGATWGGTHEAALFYEGYGPIEPDRAAVAYYRYHRIVEDIAVDCAAILDTAEGGASRAQMLGFLVRALEPGGALDVARRLDANVTIRRAVPDDAPVLARMRWDSSREEKMPETQTYAEFASGYAKFVRNALASGQWVIWVAEHDGRVVAQTYVQLVAMVPRPGRFARRLGSLGAVYAVPEARNKGIGSILLRGVKVDRVAVDQGSR
jgi:spectinomycin phosphotransferase